MVVTGVGYVDDPDWTPEPKGRCEFCEAPATATFPMFGPKGHQLGTYIELCDLHRDKAPAKP